MSSGSVNDTITYLSALLGTEGLFLIPPGPSVSWSIVTKCLSILTSRVYPECHLHFIPTLTTPVQTTRISYVSYHNSLLTSLLVAIFTPLQFFLRKMTAVMQIEIKFRHLPVWHQSLLTYKVKWSGPCRRRQLGSHSPFLSPQGTLACKHASLFPFSGSFQSCLVPAYGKLCSGPHEAKTPSA